MSQNDTPDERAAFEAFYATRSSKGVKAREQRMQRLLADGSYADDSVQRHWWTWQNALAARVQPLPPADEPALGDGLGDEDLMFTSPYYTDAQKLEFARGAIDFRNKVVANLRNRLRALERTPETAEPPALTDDYTYASKQATNCAGCGKYKHTPLRVDRMDGYVCLTCIDKRLEDLLDAEADRASTPPPEQASTEPPKNCPLCKGEGFMFNAICTPKSCGYYADHLKGQK